MSIELLRCPFCGSEPKVIKIHTVSAHICCSNELCPARPFVNDGEEVADDRGIDSYIESASKRWNKRWKKESYE